MAGRRDLHRRLVEFLSLLLAGGYLLYGCVLVVDWWGGFDEYGHAVGVGEHVAVGRHHVFITIPGLFAFCLRRSITDIVADIHYSNDMATRIYGCIFEIL